MGPLTSWFSPYVTGKMTGLRQYGYVGALIALILALDDVEFLGAGGGGGGRGCRMWLSSTMIQTRGSGC